MKLFKSLFKDNETHIGLCSLGLNEKQPEKISYSLFKSNYNKLLFQIELISPVKIEKSLIDQTLYRLS